MKIRKIVSLISSLAMVVSLFASFTATSYAAEKTPANIDVVVSEEYGYYNVDLMFSLDNTTLGIAVSKTERGYDFYSGVGIAGIVININDLPTVDGGTCIYGTASHIMASGKQENLESLNSYGYSNTISSVEELVGEGESVKLVSISTNFATDKYTSDEVKEIFSNFGYTELQVATVTDMKVGTDVSSSVIKYGISEPGKKYTDSDYSININPTEEEEPTPTATATVLGDHTGDKETEGDEADTTDKATAIVGTPVAKADATSLVWTVTSKEDKTQEFTQSVDVSGEATYKFGLVLRNITADLIKTVSAVLQ